MILLKKLKALQARLHALQPLLKCSMHLPVIAFNFFLPTKISRQKIPTNIWKSKASSWRNVSTVTAQKIC